MSTASSSRIPLLVLVGATASGKTDLLLELFSPGGRERFGLPEAVVVSADSMQAYRGMDIGTAKPSPAEAALLPHRLLDILEPSEQYTAGDFVRLADEAAEEIAASGRLPVVAGGTGFYVRNLVLGMPEAPPSDAATRAAVLADLGSRGLASLREELAAGDPDSAARIHPNDAYRITRALEVLRASGRPLSSFKPPEAPRPRYELRVACLERPREELHARIDARVRAMVERGLVEEVARLRAAGLGPEAPGMKAIGYAEFFQLEAEGLDPASAAGRSRLAGEIARNTRRYAKRQETFFRGLPGLVRIPAGPGAAERLAALARELLPAG